MIEDKTDVAMYLAENDVKVIMIDTPNNKGVRHNNIIKVHNQKYDRRNDEAGLQYLVKLIRFFYR